MAPVTLYGIPNCDNVKKSISRLKNNGVQFIFHDYKKEGIAAGKISEWLSHQPLERLLNKKSTAWKMLPPVIQKRAENPSGAVKLMQEHTNLIKRPVLEISGTILIGFNDEEYIQALKNY